LELTDHPFIVKLHYAFQTRDKLYLILDWVNGGELYFHLRREESFPEARVRLYAAQLALALHHLHSMNVIYRDLKLENVLLDSHGCKLLKSFSLLQEMYDLRISALRNSSCSGKLKHTHFVARRNILVRVGFVHC